MQEGEGEGDDEGKGAGEGVCGHGVCLCVGARESGQGSE